MMHEVESSNVKAIGYETSTNTLVVEYLSGLKYEYSNVPANVFDELLNSVSKGKYMNQNIKGQYEGRRVQR
jgi:hypothetical protein